MKRRAWYNPFSWFRRAGPPELSEAEPEIQFSRSARDSTNIPMDVVVTLRMPDALRQRGARRAREMGLTLGEYIRLLLTASLDDADDAGLIQVRKGNTYE